MLELTGVASILRGISILYWIVAAGALIAVLWWVRHWWGKLIGTLVVIGLFGFFPAKGLIEAKEREAYAREAWAYFKKLCAAKSGEKIYKTFTGVKSVLVVKPLPPAKDKDHYDQFWYGDPYSYPAFEDRGEGAARRFIGNKILIAQGIEGNGFDFVEIRRPGNKVITHQRLSATAEPPYYRKLEDIQAPLSRFGVSWEDISAPDDRKYWVAGSRLRVVDLTDSSVVAERIGFYIEAGFGSQAGQRRPWLTSKGPRTTCPESHDYADRWFILKVLQPAGENTDGK